jgi:hypothetical protein
MESQDVTFFENIFLMKYAYSLPSSSNEFISKLKPTIEPIINPHENEEDDNDVALEGVRDKGLQNPMVKTSLCTS